MLIFNEAKDKLSLASREKKLEHFYSLFKKGESVLDVGISTPFEQEQPGLNYFLKNYRYAPETYMGLGVEDLSGMEDLYPGKRFVQYSGKKFPFLDKQFDWVFSNAVIEHVGDDDAQLLFLNEMMRVASNVFFTTPNKYFPVDSHTDVFFLHWNDELFYRWREKNQRWQGKYAVYLFSFGRLQNLLKNSHAISFSIHKNRLMGVPMTFTVTCTDLGT
jgi:hypothetical protein